MLRVFLLTVASLGFVICLQNIDDLLDDYVEDVDTKDQTWAVLVAGSNGWINYRHQADVCHAYQVLRNHGVPDERIVVMMYDDLVSNPKNPTPGTILNHPNGKNVYQNVPRDYTGDDVTPDNFLNILQGNEENMKNIGSGKVIKSGPNDHVFFYFADHGAPGLLRFPDISNGEEQFILAGKLVEVLKKMHEEKKFKKMVIYVEACCSASMFKNLPDNINVYATTAANSTESSYATYWDWVRRTFLGDLYSVSWLEDSDKNDLTTETLQTQYETVKRETFRSHVQQCGDISIAEMPVAQFQGREREKPRPFSYKPVPREAVRTQDVPLEILKRELMASNAEIDETFMKAQRLFRNRYLADNIVKSIVQRINPANVQAILTQRQEITNFDCYENVVHHFHKQCFNLNKNQYLLEKLQVLVNMCESNLAVDKIKNAMEKTCIHPPTYGII